MRIALPSDTETALTRYSRSLCLESKQDRSVAYQSTKWASIVPPLLGIRRKRILKNDAPTFIRFDSRKHRFSKLLILLLHRILLITSVLAKFPSMVSAYSVFPSEIPASPGLLFAISAPAQFPLDRFSCSTVFLNKLRPLKISSDKLRFFRDLSP